MSVRSIDPTEEKSSFERGLEWLAAKRPVTWFLVNIGNRVDPVLMRTTGGRLRVAPGSPTVLIRHTGAKSGKERTTPLAYFTQDDQIILIASKGGAPKHPAWYHNLKANPDVEATTDGKFEPYRAREAEGGERDHLWQLATTLYSGYDGYQERATERRIPVMVLEPKGD
jgi:deazaflavin-dependent oxidoreductase (nitroreductase family)